MLGWELPPRFAGGVGVVCEALCRALGRRGRQVTYLMPCWDGAGSEASVPVVVAGRRLLALEVPSQLVSYASSAPGVRVPGEIPPPTRTPLYGPDLLEAVERFASDALETTLERAIAFDVIHAHDWTTFPAGLWLREATGKPLVVHVHITEFDKSGGDYADPRVYEIERQGMLGADLVVAVSRRVAETCIDRYGLDPGRVRVVHNGIDPDPQAVPSPALPGPLVLFLGRITLQKGPEYFVRAARRLLDVLPEAHFVMAGSGDQLPRMVELAAELGLGPRMLFAGFVDRRRAAELYASADLFVMPSVSEPFGIVPLEAMDRGVPVIVSRQSGVAEVLRNALKVDFWDVEELAAKMVAALRYRGLAGELRGLGLAEVAGMSWQQAADQIERVYGEVVHA